MHKRCNTLIDDKNLKNPLEKRSGEGDFVSF